MKIHKCESKDGDFRGYMFMCPACECGHIAKEGWTFNGDFEKPTFTPSFLVTWLGGYGENAENRICHSFVRDGQIQFLEDSTHHLKGQTVPLEEF